MIWYQHKDGGVYEKISDNNVLNGRTLVEYKSKEDGEVYVMTLDHFNSSFKPIKIITRTDICAFCGDLITSITHNIMISSIVCYLFRC